VRLGYPPAVANIKSQIKRNRQNEVRRQRNRRERSSLRTRVRRFSEAIESGDRAEAAEAYRVAARAFDRAASKGVIHKNKAANSKSRLARRLNKPA
jgi:small subunit ribosomal protein S20